MKKSIGVISLLFVLVLSACGATNFQELADSSVTEESTASVDDIPDEPSQDEIISQIKNNEGNDVEEIISDNFYLLDVVSGENGNAHIYATQKFTIQELVSTITSVAPPEEKSEQKDNRQILIYPGNFVTFKVSEEDKETVLIEIASDEFVENNYSPNYLNGFFTFLLLNQMLGTNNWRDRQANRCRSGNCYGGYTTGNTYNPNGTPKRGSSGYRGGGPSSGK